MSDEMLVKCGSPTLAGIKTGNLFTCPYTDRKTTMEELRKLNRKLVPKGLRILPLRYSSERVLIYLYRPKSLERDLAKEEAVELLEKAGYRHKSANQCLIELIHRINDLEAEFPHEIGLFLSYPPEDVRGFIAHSEDRSVGCKLVGTWRVYGDPDKARKLFDMYKKCTDNYWKHIVIFLLLVFTIGLISGFLVADGSMIIAYRESFDKYNIEDGNFRTDEEISRSNRRDIEEFGVDLFENFYVEKKQKSGNTLRIFRIRSEVNLLCLMKGELPRKEGELVLDRMYADNNDTMFDAVKFGIAAVGAEDFAKFHSDELTYCYSWKYRDNRSLSKEEEKKISDRLMEDIAGEIYLQEFIPRYLNQAIQFTGDDMGGDRAMMLILLYIVILIIAFVFVITIRDTIIQEAAVIGTLRALGFTKGELVIHYMALPLYVTLAAALTGNVLGYSVMKDVCAGMYYASYSLPTYVTVWNTEAFLLTTVVPLLIMLAVTFFTLWNSLSLTPLQFLRKNFHRRGGRSLPLPERLPFFMRFRLRIFFQNFRNYVILLIGILFANLLLLFGMALPAVLDRYQASMKDNMLCKYQYFLNIPAYKKDRDYEFDKVMYTTFLRLSAMTTNKSAEAFSSCTLTIPEGEALRVENITVYGVKKDSRYVRVPIARGEIWISAAYADKCRIHVGDTIRLKEPYEEKYYRFTVSGIYDYMGGLCMFMQREDMIRTFGFFDEFLSGYFSNSEITDISRDLVASVVDYDTLIKVSRQLDVSMGSMMILVDGFAVALFMILLYLLSKIVIEKNAQSISMTKILGYSDVEIARLYIVTTSIVTLVLLAVTIPVSNRIMHAIFQNYLASRMTGWITYDIPDSIFIKMFLIGTATYIAVALFELRKIRAIPMTDALKDVM